LIFTWSAGFSHIGMRGYVAGYVFSSGLCAFLNFLCLKKRLRLSPRIGNWFVTPLIASLFSGLICDITYNFMLSRALPLSLCLVAASVCALISYAISLGAMGTNIVKYMKTLIPHGV
ncbi:MAG: polysaccharide biosynthesis C-terminal domain-containing protein, partial [Oscillospiraceae bacterium]|nr:polysaccharide biosynthesis C-terminal domain-containing protein [Oscillospiraceae bacterium]